MDPSNWSFPSDGLFVVDYQGLFCFLKESLLPAIAFSRGGSACWRKFLPPNNSASSFSFFFFLKL